MKPADFFLGVVTFFGVLVPGALFLVLEVNVALGVNHDAWNRAAGPIPPWLLFGGIAYLVGQLLLAVTELLNASAEPIAGLIFPILHNDVCAFRKEASSRIDSITIGSRQARFHAALSFLRTEKAVAAAEVDHHMADYKLLRNLLAVLLIDSVVRVVASTGAVRVLLLESILLMACFVAFVRMFCWAELLAFQYVCFIADKEMRTASAVG